MTWAFSKSKAAFTGVCVNAEGIGTNDAVIARSKESRFTSVPPAVRARVKEVSDSPGIRSKLRIALASARDREVIYRQRHDVFARELSQHAENAEQRLTDPLDIPFNRNSRNE
jgi:hypothetical protein